MKYIVINDSFVINNNMQETMIDYDESILRIGRFYDYAIRNKNVLNC